MLKVEGVQHKKLLSENKTSVACLHFLYVPAFSLHEGVSYVCASSSSSAFYCFKTCLDRYQK